MRAISWMLVASLAALVGVAGLAAASPSITVVDAPEVTVANPSETMTQDNFNPDYTFSAEVRVVNDGDESQIHLEAWIVEDPSIEACDEDNEAYPVTFVRKTRTLDPGEEARFGGSASVGDGDDAYWPMAVSEAYGNAETGEEARFGGEEYTVCALVRVSGDDPSCDRAVDRSCVVAQAPFRVFVREENQPPEVTTFSISNEAPRPGQQVLLEADATDADDQPREDDLSFTWQLGAQQATGQTVRHAFPQGTHTVTLEVTDGFDTVTETMEVTVGEDGDAGPLDEAPLGPLLGVLALGAAAALGRAR